MCSTSSYDNAQTNCCPGLYFSCLCLYQIFGKLQVKGAGVSSPYRLRPFVGVRVPLNSTYSPIIYMHNPHTTPIQVSKDTDPWYEGIEFISGLAVYIILLTF
jgi:hypothetical protein